MPVVLQRLTRHSHITTTMSYYVSSTADEIGADLWAALGDKPAEKPAEGNSLGNSTPKRPKGQTGQAMPNPLCSFLLCQVDRAGVEPATPGFSVQCSTN